MSLRRVEQLLKTHFDEAEDALVDKAPSSLRRGEGTEKNFFIMKIDLVGSTQLLWSKRQATYLKMAHTFLSTVDRITQDYGADPEQVEYAGDGLFAYFPAIEGAGEKVLIAAFYAKAAVDRMANLGGAVGALKPRCRIVLHYAPLTVARIGPRAGSILSAIGMPIHRVAKLEKDIAPGVARATIEFRTQLDRKLWKYFETVYKEVTVAIPVPPPPPPPPPLSNNFGNMAANTGLLGALLQAQQPKRPSLNSLMLTDYMAPSMPAAQAYKTEKTIVGYNIWWSRLADELH
ncbi:hypothetical protein [Polaromonas sp.]|uniref:hypothetical protein n=1 Tax=Polaromonas sp. TaxID=1869339 RepID=UPI002FC6DD62